jgi:uncharacterized membrane protein YheB (UPF0754 family)
LLENIIDTKHIKDYISAMDGDITELEVAQRYAEEIKSLLSEDELEKEKPNELWFTDDTESTDRLIEEKVGEKETNDVTLISEVFRIVNVMRIQDRNRWPGPEYIVKQFNALINRMHEWFPNVIENKDVQNLIKETVVLKARLEAAEKENQRLDALLVQTLKEHSIHSDRHIKEIEGLLCKISALKKEIQKLKEKCNKKIKDTLRAAKND